MLQRSSSTEDILRRYGLAILVAIASLLLRKALSPVLGEQNPYHTAWAAVAVSSWYCGLVPSIITVLLEIVGIWYLFLVPFHSFASANPKADIAGTLAFVLFSGFIIAMGEANRRSLAKSQWAEEQLRKSYDELELKVRERTTDLKRANDNLGELSGRLQEMRDEERRQISRELHDSVGQLLAALNMNIGMVEAQSNKLDPAAARAVADSSGLIDQISREIRTLSHLLHPPLMDVAGLSSALAWYVDGFSERSKIKVDLEIPPALGRLPDQIELAIFRMVQECLTNIHRHSESATASIAVRQQGHSIVVEIKDSGKGIPLERQLELSSSGRTGVGFRGMRERLRQLGAELDIQSDVRGTLVTAALPLPAEPSDDHDIRGVKNQRSG